MRAEVEAYVYFAKLKTSIERELAEPFDSLIRHSINQDSIMEIPKFVSIAVGAATSSINPIYNPKTTTHTKKKKKPLREPFLCLPTLSMFKLKEFILCHWNFCRHVHLPFDNGKNLTLTLTDAVISHMKHHMPI